MHRPSSITDIHSLRLGSLLLLGNRLLILTAGSLLLVSLFANEEHLLVFGSTLVAISLVLIISPWIAASYAGCRLCRTKVLAPMGCVKHRKTLRFPGSIKLRLALAIIFEEKFRCPHCNEPTAVEMNEKLGGMRLQGSEMAR